MEATPHFHWEHFRYLHAHTHQHHSQSDQSLSALTCDLSVIRRAYTTTHARAHRRTQTVRRIICIWYHTHADRQCVGLYDIAHTHTRTHAHRGGDICRILFGFVARVRIVWTAGDLLLTELRNGGVLNSSIRALLHPSGFAAQPKGLSKARALRFWWCALFRR